MSSIGKHSDARGQVGQVIPVYQLDVKNVEELRCVGCICLTLGHGSHWRGVDNETSSSGLLTVLWDMAGVLGTCGVVGTPMVVAGCGCSIWEVIGRRVCVGPAGGVLLSSCIAEVASGGWESRTSIPFTYRTVCGAFRLRGLGRGDSCGSVTVRGGIGLRRGHHRQWRGRDVRDW